MKTQLKTRPRSVFEQSLPIVAAALGRLCGVAIEFGGDVPSTDGKTIWMPMPEAMTQDDELKTLGILCHEAGHVRFTDFGNVRQKCTPLERAIDNALEDCRIEAAMSRLYPGAEMLFEKAHAAKVQELAAWPEFKARVLVPIFLLAVSEERLLHRKWIAPLATKLLEHMRRMFGREMTDKLTALALEVRNAQSTADVVAIRKRIIRLLKRAATSASGAPKSPGKQNRSSDQSLAKQTGKQTNDQAGQQTRQGKSPTSHLETAAQPALQEVLQPCAAPIDNPLDISNHFKRLKPDEGVPGLKLDISGRIRPVPRREDLGRERLQRARKDSVALRLALRGLVQAKARIGRRITEQGRRFSTSHLWRFVVSDSRVFEARTDRQAPNAAIHILLDMSGSMGLEGGDLAVRSSLGLVMGLESIRGVSPALTVFPGSSCGCSAQAVCTVLRHGERLARVTAGELGAITSWGGTPLQQALQAGGFALSACKESKKAIILITDGRVGAEENHRIIAQLQDAGIHVLGIQIGDADDLTNMAIDSVHIKDVSDLQQALFSFAKRLLL